MTQWRWMGIAGWVVACGGAPAAETPDDSAATDTTPPTAASGDTVEAPASDPAAASTEADSEGDDDDDEVEIGEDDPDPNAARDKIYKQTKDGLEVEIAGVRFLVKATPKLAKLGGWGVKVTVSAKSVNGGTHSLQSPDEGPLAFASRIKKGDKVIEQKSDTRSGDGEAAVAPDYPKTFERTWPGKKERGARSGQELELMVGLWGLASSTIPNRPVKKFVRVRMVVAGNRKPQAIVVPPE